MMPKKNTEEQVAEPVEASPVEGKPVLCGHVDRHSLGVDRKPDHPSCDLEPGHTGDHHGWHKMKVETERFYERETGKLLKVEYEEVDAEIWWTDMAGTPAKDIKPGPLPSRNKKSELLQAIEQLMA